ncbi:Wat1-related protein [Thalictrum thalictroides]|uniref:WAT1-related protein n=1 Tax=Thalictrum thalictroides TaxID=46969 RepID=A0A7J6X2X8_THATH|nr:Wat1-related protein [Thalictrum thalictroides]
MALGLIEPVIDQNLYYMGMKYTSATFASAMCNILPAITFIMAIIFRLERVSLKSTHSQAKIVGTIVTLGGAMLMTLYKGPILEMFSGRTPTHHSGTTSTSSGTGQNIFVGTLMLIGSCIGWSGFFILQSVTLKEYPAELSLTALIVLLGMIQGGAVALVMEHDFKAWAIGFDSRLLAPVYSGIVCSAMAYYLQGVVIKDRGPVFVTAFNPLCMIIVAALGSLILAEQLHLGSVIGAVVIVMGLYAVIWGKSQDHIESPTLAKLKGSSLELPVAAKDVMEHESTIIIGGLPNKSEIPTTIVVSQN